MISPCSKRILHHTKQEEMWLLTGCSLPLFYALHICILWKCADCFFWYSCFLFDEGSSIDLWPRVVLCHFRKWKMKRAVWDACVKWLSCLCCTWEAVMPTIGRCPHSVCYSGIWGYAKDPSITYEICQAYSVAIMLWAALVVFWLASWRNICCGYAVNREFYYWGQISWVRSRILWEKVGWEKLMPNQATEARQHVEEMHWHFCFVCIKSSTGWIKRLVINGNVEMW